MKASDLLDPKKMTFIERLSNGQRTVGKIERRGRKKKIQTVESNEEGLNNLGHDTVAADFSDAL